MEDRQLNRSAHGFLDSGVRILLVGLAVALAGGIVLALGAATTDWLQGVGGMIATLGGVIATVGLVLLLIAAVTRRKARHRPFA